MGQARTDEMGDAHNNKGMKGQVGTAWNMGSADLRAAILFHPSRYIGMPEGRATLRVLSARHGAGHAARGNQDRDGPRGSHRAVARMAGTSVRQTASVTHVSWRRVQPRSRWPTIRCTVPRWPLQSLCSAHGSCRPRTADRLPRQTKWSRCPYACHVRRSSFAPSAMRSSTSAKDRCPRSA